EIGARQKDLADAELSLAGHLPLAADVFLEEILRDLHMNAGAVARLAVGIDGAAVPHGLQRGNAGLDDLPPRPAVDGRDQANAAGIMLLRRVVESVRGEMRGIAPPFADEAVCLLLVVVASHCGPPDQLLGSLRPRFCRSAAVWLSTSFPT